jgi:SAM-dependent methyltransferase
MDEEIFNREDLKYGELWEDGYRASRWPWLAERLVDSVYCGQSVIDFGFGNGEALEFFDWSGLRTSGVEVSSSAIDRQSRIGRDVHHATIDDLHFLPDNYYEFGFSHDVLEHLPPGNVGAAISEMGRVCRDRLFVSVCPTPSHHLSHEGENLHLTVWPLTWWEGELGKIGNVKKLWKLFSRSGRYVVDLGKV